MSQTSKWWGVYDNRSKTWRTENQRSNFDDFIGRLIFYPSPAIAEAHRQMIVRFMPAEEVGRYEVREFTDTHNVPDRSQDTKRPNPARRLPERNPEIRG